MKRILLHLSCLALMTGRYQQRFGHEFNPEAWDQELTAPAFLGSSVKNEDWGPGGANQRNRPNPQPQRDGAAAPAKPSR